MTEKEKMIMGKIYDPSDEDLVLKSPEDKGS